MSCRAWHPQEGNWGSGQHSPCLPGLSPYGGVPLPPHWAEWFLYIKRALWWLCPVSSVKRALEGKGWPRSHGEAVCSKLGPQQLVEGVLEEVWPRAEVVTLEQEVRGKTPWPELRG